MRESKVFVAAAMLTTLAACGAEQSATSGEAGEPIKTSSNDGWDATDACKVVDSATMSAAAGKTVSDTVLAMVNEAGQTTAATSECTYDFEGGGQAKVLLRWSPIDDNTVEAIKLARSTSQQTMEAFGGTVSDVPGLGKAAFYSDMAQTLNVFIGEDRFAIITLPDEPGVKERTIALAKKLGA